MRTIQFIVVGVMMMLSISGVSQPEIDSVWQQNWKQVKNGKVISLPEGTFYLTETLVLEGKKDVQIKGAGMGKTILSFAGSDNRTTGIQILNSENIRLEGFTLVDPGGDGIYTSGVHNVQFLFIEVLWNQPSNASATGVGIHADKSQRVLFFESKVTGAPGAGLQITKCEQVVIRKCIAGQSRIGMLSVNSSYVDIVENNVTGNSSGIVLHDKSVRKADRSWDIEVYKNTIRSNNREADVSFDSLSPIPGTGVVLLAVSDVSVFENVIDYNRSGNVMILSYPLMGSTSTFARSYSERIFVRNNTFASEKSRPIASNAFGKLLKQKLGKQVPHIIYDGIQDEIAISPTTGRLLPEHKICIYDNTDESFINLDAGHGFKAVSRDLALFRCK